ncbi:MAG: response regulator [Proteobacteria bacterium]|nr:response regulator [Pseudomonadota bacterium]
MSGTVLLVDDEPHVIEGLAAALRSEPYAVLGATSGHGALELLAQYAVDVIVSDERMPGMKGSELLTRVRHLYPDTVRIVLTGQAELDSALAAINDGEVLRYLLKPCHGDELKGALREAMRQRARNRATSQFLEAARIAQQAALRPDDALAGVPGSPPAPGSKSGDMLSCLPEQERSSLSRRETEILRELVAGKSVKDIAKTHFVSPHTVRNHIKAIYRKLNVHSQRELMHRFVDSPGP